MRKIKIITLLLNITLLFGVSFGYFENKYYCQVSNNTILVTLNKGTGSQKCLDYIKSFNSKVQTIDNNIATANGYISGGLDIEYWTNVRNDLNRQRTQIVDLKSRITEYMSSFEGELFIKIKKLLNYYLNNDLNALNAQYSVNISQRIKSLDAGDEALYQELLNKSQDNLLKINLIKVILNSDNFETLIPYLKHYLKYYQK